MFTHFGLFDVAKGGEKMGILDIKILYFQNKNKKGEKRKEKVRLRMKEA